MTTDRGAVLLRDLLIVTKDGDWGKGQPHDGYIPYRVIRGADFPAVRAGDVSGVPLRYLAARTVGRRTLQPNDIIIETAGGTKDRPTGRTLLVTKGLLERLGSHVTCASFARFLRVNPARADPRFVYWYLQYLYVAGEMAQHQVQHTGVARLQYTRFAETQQVPLPTQGVQAAIADLLGALDAKIELNEHVQDVSHELAAALLAEMLQTAESRGVLHPGQLRDVASVNIRKVKPAEGRLSYLDISAVRPGRAGEPAQMTWEEAPGRARRGVKDGDVLWSTVRPNRKSHCLVLSPPPDLVVSTGFAVLTPTSVGASFLYGITERPEFVDYLVSVAEGSAYPAVRGERFLEAPVVVPPRQMLDAYEAASMPLRRRAHAALRESRGLERLREAIMPPLLSGDLRVSAAKALVGEAV